MWNTRVPAHGVSSTFPIGVVVAVHVSVPQAFKSGFGENATFAVANSTTSILPARSKEICSTGNPSAPIMGALKLSADAQDAVPHIKTAMVKTRIIGGVGFRCA
jgi:hypothetical protein